MGIICINTVIQFMILITELSRALYRVKKIGLRTPQYDVVYQERNPLCSIFGVGLQGMMTTSATRPCIAKNHL